jgi:5-methylcytosine-specific restriction endonuclease McrA
MAPIIGALPPQVAFLSDDATSASRARDSRLVWRAWYKTARWQRLRWSVLVESLFTCAMCKVVHGDTAQLVADHKVAHRGNAALFWDRDNLQCLCKACHDSTKQAEEARGRGWVNIPKPPQL